MMSDFLAFSEGTLQEIALVVMALVYTTRIIWYLRFKAGGDRQAPTGAGVPMPARSIIYSWANIALPGTMESTRKRPFLYAQFVIFHLGVVAAIGLSFIIPYGPGLLEYTFLQVILQIMIGAACVVGIIRIFRRVGSVYMRAISTPDDYFSLLLLTVWFGFAFFAVPNDISGGEGIMLTYFLLTAFFLLYVPFSKISHYLYYPFTRYYLGKTLGHRGVFPIKHASQD
jgi:nitrate reductase gamma subunit